MNANNFTPKTDIDEYLNDNLNIEIYDDLTRGEDWKGIFKPLEFLNLLYEQWEVVKENKNKPLALSEHLFSLKYDEYQIYYFIHYLKKLIWEKSGGYDLKDKQLNICYDFILDRFNELENKLYPPQPQGEKEDKEEQEEKKRYNFNNTLEHISTLPTVAEKIKYLIEVKTEYKQNKKWFIDTAWETPFDRKCDLEINKLKEILELENNNHTPFAPFKISQKKGAKTDLIRIFNSLYELQLIDKSDGMTPTKQEFFNSLGEFLNEDFSQYYVNLSQAFQNQPLEVNLKVFESMKNVVIKNHLQTK